MSTLCRIVQRCIGSFNVTKSITCTSSQLPNGGHPNLPLTLRTPLTGGLFHTSCSTHKNPAGPPKEPKRWLEYNDIVYPPRKPGELIRPAEITHCRPNVKYSQKKLWYIASMIRGMSIDEAFKQLSFYNRKGAQIVKEALEDAQAIAVNEHNVEYKSNLWIADSQVGRARVIKGVRKHARRQNPGIIQYRYTHYFVRLREGQPPEHYYQPRMTGHEKMEDHLQTLRSRRIIRSL